jgi:hypothetical protein
MLLLKKLKKIFTNNSLFEGYTNSSPVFISDELKGRDKENKKVKKERSTNFHSLNILIY